nr:MAG TPA: hypothetical protein [Caudoviricetes sp.]
MFHFTTLPFFFIYNIIISNYGVKCKSFLKIYCKNYPKGNRSGQGGSDQVLPPIIW